MSGKNYLKIRLTTQQLSFLISNILCKIIVNDLKNQNILKDIFEDKLQKRSKPKMMKKRKCWNKVGIFRIFKWTTDFVLWNSEQGTGEWLLLGKWFGTFFTSKSLFSWMSVRGFFYKGGEWEFLKMAFPQKWLLPSKWLFPENGFSWEITSPQEIQNTSHFNLIWELLCDFV